MRKLLLTFITYVFIFNIQAQYTVNGDATQESCRCYTLTTTNADQHCTVWNNNRIDLLQNFNFYFQVYLGCADGNGADGMAFVLQNAGLNAISTATGGGMAIEGIAPLAAITLDTYQNTSPDNDPAYDHIAIQINGNLNHNSANCLTPLTPISATSDNVEDCQNHILRVSWDAASKTMTVYFDGQLRLTKNYDFVANVFGGTSQVYWGFSGATGGLSNLQKFCTALTPNFYFPPTQKKCVNEPIQFLDSTVSFGGVVKYYWNFGDGSPIDSVHVNPVHTYTTPGQYNVVFRVRGLDGCEESITRIVNIGATPLANFSHTENCATLSVQFNDLSTVSSGNVNTWYWNFDNAGITSTQQNPTTSYAAPGPKNIVFVVKSAEGCISDTLRRTINIGAGVQPTFSALSSVCTNTAAFTLSGGTPATVAGVGAGVYSGPGVNTATGVFSPSAAGPGSHVISYTYTTVTGCVGTATQSIQVIATQNAVINSVSPICVNDAPIILIGNPSGGLFSGSGVTSSGTFDPSISGSGTPSVTYSFPGDPCIIPATLSLVVHPIPNNVSAGPGISIVTGGGANLQGTGNGGTVIWTPPAGLSDPASLTPFANPTQTTIYTLTVQNNFGCSVSDSMTLAVTSPCLDPMKIFTPNNDGFYEKWIVFSGSCISKVEANVYNRYGSLVYHSNDYQNNWDGTYNGKKLPDATYYYVLNVTDNNGIKYTKKGSVTIMR